MQIPNEVTNEVTNETAQKQEVQQQAYNKEMLCELEILNNIIAQLLEEQQQSNAKMARDIKSIKTVATFFLIIGIIALFPLISSIIGSCVKLL